MTPLFIVVSLSLGLLLVALWRRQIALRRENYIRSFVLPHGLFDQLRAAGGRFAA